MLRAGAGTEKSAIPHVTPGWKKLRELLPLLAYRVFSHKMIEKIYTAGFKSFKLCSSKDWILKQSDISRVSRTDMQMAQWMCNVSQRDRKSSTEFRNRLGVVNRCFASNKIGMVWAC